MNVKVDDLLLREYGYEIAERAAILEYEAGYTREEAEAAAVKWAMPNNGMRREPTPGGE